MDTSNRAKAERGASQHLEGAGPGRCVNANGNANGDMVIRSDVNGHTSEYRNGYLNNGTDNESENELSSSGPTNGHILGSKRSETPPPPDDNERDAPSATTRRKQLQDELVQRIIEDAKNNRSPIVQLKNKGIRMIPEELLELSHVQYLYLEGNELTSLPDDFFDRLPALRWLDLRRNYLASLPSTYIGSHKNLKTLLLEGNELKTLPLELSLIPTLNGLNICNNPLEFPPTEVIERGAHAVLTFLRDLLKAKSQGKLAPRMEDLVIDSDTGSSSSEEWERPLPRKYSEQYRPPISRDLSKDSRDSGMSDSELVGPVLTSAALHKHAPYNEVKQKHMDKVRKAGALGTLEKKSNEDERLILPLRKQSKKNRRLKKADHYPEPPPQDRVKQRYLEDQRLYQEKQMNDHTDMILQKRRDQEELKKFRDEGKRLQMGRYREAMIHGGALEPVEVATKAPFGIEKEHLKVPTNEERIAQAVKDSHEKMRRRRALSPRSQAKMEADRLINQMDQELTIARDKELEKRIKTHMLTMQDRRKAPKGTPQQEMEAARKELEIASQLQAELEARRKNLEYRFTAFTGS